MSRFSRYNPLAGLRDLRLFLHSRQKHELVFAFLAVVATVVLIVGFLLDSRDLKAPYKRDIQYVQSWPLNRTDAEIIAAQKADMKTRAAEEAKRKEQEAKNRAALKRIDDALTRWGF
ncbi:hypothetical protein GON01_03245 [Sphingomonas sp. MAH-20]|jgi:hypothetical protein|uniref:Uncharacterized protein n=1 Tax=Sphingomonas horti TaxID=2682842 RepID=A0A6I4IXS8_9SPHN|nr:MULTISPECIES: hypothetical protein [Sphingomonas]MBA2920968.1 hypothetical protein [Sphingomonas sp. CGMCC 1.13658]MVO76954.1 hypothetical protein [Sphingomonas horti]